MLSPSLFWMDRISPDRLRFQYDSSFSRALPSEDLPSPGGAFCPQALPGVPFRFPAGEDENALQVQNVALPLPPVKCTGIWILASSETVASVAKSVIRYADGMSEETMLNISQEQAAELVSSERTILTIAHHHFKWMERWHSLPIHIYAQRITARCDKVPKMLELEVQDGGRITLYAVTMAYVGQPPQTRAVTGKVVTQTGIPIHGALVKLGPYAGRTDQNGQFEFSDVVPGNYRLNCVRLACYPFEEQKIRVTSGDGPHVIGKLRMESRLLPCVWVARKVLRIVMALLVLILTAELIFALRWRARAHRNSSRDSSRNRCLPVSSFFSILLDLREGETVSCTPTVFGMLVCVLLLSTLS